MEKQTIKLRSLFEHAADLSYKLTLITHEACDEFENVYGREPDMDSSFMSGMFNGEGSWEDVIAEEESHE